jgi:helicase required for RNAi-mediated heterochromatin assembly 1
MVALTPAHDMFQTICRVCVVAARPLVNLSMSPPSIDILFSSPDDLEVDPQMEWVMVEARGGYLEAYRHTLEAIKRMAFEKFVIIDF